MLKDNELTSKLLTAVSVLGALFVLTETILQAFGKSICVADGCRLVASQTRFGDISILLAGLALFSVLAVLSALSLREGATAPGKYLNFLLVVSLACEGFFTGYQAFRLHAACVFCLVVFGFLVLLSVVRLLQGEKSVLAGFASLLAVFSLFYLILPAEGTVIPSQKQLVLFYGKDCKYCAEVIKVLDEKQISVDHVLVNEYSGFLKGMGIEHVPTLYVNKNSEKIFLTGRESILTYLNCKPEVPAKTPAVKEKPLPKKQNRAGSAGSTVGVADLTGGAGESFQMVLPSAEEGICKSDEACK